MPAASAQRDLDQILRDYARPCDEAGERIEIFKQTANSERNCMSSVTGHATRT